MPKHYRKVKMNCGTMGKKGKPKVRRPKVRVPKYIGKAGR